MHDRFFTFPGSDSATHIFMAGEPNDSGLHARFADGRAAEWGRLPTKLARGDVRALRLFDLDELHRTIPPIVYELSNLAFLGVPSHLLAQLDAGALPASVRTLWMETEGVASVPPQSVFTRVERIASATFRMATLSLAAPSFPELRHLHVKLDRKASMLDAIPGMRRLVELSIGPCADPRIFEALRGLDLEFLILSRGTLPSLSGIEGLRSLTDARVVRLTKLGDIRALQKLPQLREVSMLDCPHLKTVGALLKIPKLEALTLWGCRDTDGAIAAIVPPLEKRQLRELLVT